LPQLFDGIGFGHVMNKATQYAIDDDRISKNLALMSVKFAQRFLQLCITWPKKLGMLTIFNFCNSSNFWCEKYNKINFILFLYIVEK
jgi:hypothetical protein